MWIASLIRPQCSRAKGRWRIRALISCETCNKKFDVIYGRRHQRFCSLSCARAGASEETRHKRAIATGIHSRRRWSDPETRSRLIAAMDAAQNAEAAEARARGIRRTMATQEFKAKRSTISRLLVSKVRLTNVHNGNVRESRGERALVAWLRSVLGDDAVLHHPPRVQGADIDVYVRSADAYIQFDGIYYHGLDRPYDSLSPAIRRKYDRDRSVDALFARLGLRLVRITDKAWAALTSEELRTNWLREEVLRDTCRGEPDAE